MEEVVATKPLPYKRQSSAVNEGVLDMLESLGDLSLSMSVPTSSPPRPTTPSPEPIKEEERSCETLLRNKKEREGCSRPMSVPAFSVFRRKTSSSSSSSLTERPKSPERRPNSLQPRPSTPTNLLRPISPAPAPRRGATSHDQTRLRPEPNSALIRPEPRKASMLSELAVPGSRLSADYTALDQHITPFTPIENFKITNQKNKFQPKNEVRFEYFNETFLNLFP